MKKTFFILALLAIVLQTAATGIIYFRFQLNRDYISKNLCVKKEVKNNCCQGSCHLKKQMGEEEKKEKSPTAPSIKVQGHFQLFCQQNQVLRLLPAPFTSNLFSPYSFSKKSFAVNSVFHPPAC